MKGYKKTEKNINIFNKYITKKNKNNKISVNTLGNNVPPLITF